MKNRFKDIIRFVNSTADEHMGAFAAQSAFFIFLSFFPIVNILINIPRYLPITDDQLLEILYAVLPSRFETYVGNIVADMYENSSGSVAIISVVIAVWSAAKGIMAIKYGLNEVYRSRQTRNYFIIRSISAVYTVVFLVLLVALIPLNMFGTQIAMFILNKFPEYSNETWLVLSLRGSATFVLLFVMFELMYTIVPDRKLKFRNQVPGALFAAFSWVTATKIFSLYIDVYASKSYMYGSLTTVIMLMFWLDIVIYLVFVGAQINEYLHVCRKREAEYELSKYSDDVTEVWDDDEIEDTSELKSGKTESEETEAEKRKKLLGEYTEEEMNKILDQDPETFD
ncbi:MAG: YihY/virulence factor BrkB family protein [Eubacterium sp.]|nr:YihY/virulence factor BrkB family protein [Eubacterium sp.]